MAGRGDLGLTLIELLIALLLAGVLMTAAAMSLNPILLAWSSQMDRIELNRQLQHGLERAVRDLRGATNLANDTNDAIRYTLRESGVSNSYILYLYHADDTWPPAFNQTAYQLRKASLTGGINGTFTYGGGDLLMRDVQPPAASDLSVSGSLATLDLTLVRKTDETFRLVEKVKRRN
ncbi:MAG: prepilin-type N-terminal cleavage/methylation domain-containing protein [Candidatus Omnitrophica bacterium]|nr:prepilin-type N-terminal cleavage/methylation domain-containing protein [Candidatus Omnitrophota bacterium]